MAEPMARYRVIRDCCHPLTQGEPHRLLTAGMVIELGSGIKPPRHLERLTSPSKRGK